LASYIKSFLKRTGEFFQKTEKKKLIMFGMAAVIVLTVGIVGAVLLNRVKYTVLYSGLEASEAGTIMTLLEEKGVAAKPQGTSAILVPEDVADELRIELASEGYPNTGLNYDIFSDASALGSTDDDRRTLRQYQLQENMRTTINRMDKVKDSIVIVNLATTSSFVISDNTTDASVSVMLDLENGQTLTYDEAKTIGQLVKTCVPELTLENISIVDAQMNYYDVLSDGEEAPEEYSASQQQLTEEMKEVLSGQAMRVLEPAMGKGNVAVSVNLSLDFDKETVNSVEFAPPVKGEDDGLVRSYQELYNAVGSTTAAEGQAGTDSNGVGAPEYVDEDEKLNESESYDKTYNYELNEIQTQIEKAQGAVQDLSVAVLVNSNVEGITGYVDSVKNLVAQSIGVKPEYISVELMPFVESSGDGLGELFKENQETIRRQELYKHITMIAIPVVILLAAVIILKMFLKKKQGAAEEQLSLQAVAVTAGDFDMEEEEDINTLQEIVIKKSSQAERIEELMDKYPETVAQILRTWLAEDN
jgi:flagellar M-ring protein FliF